MRKLLVPAIVCALMAAAVPASARPAGFWIKASVEDRAATFYYRTAIPSSGSGWLAGDRTAYRCAYMFLRSGGGLVGRVTFTRIEYATINDKYMDEGVRWYDGTVYEGPLRELDDCPEPTEPYEELRGSFGPLPRIRFVDAHSGQVLEVRNYRKVKQLGNGPRWRFRIDSVTPDRVTVIAYVEREPVMAIYYDRMTPTIRLASNAVVRTRCVHRLSVDRWGSEWARAHARAACV
jgi:hypothetical protein